MTRGGWMLSIALLATYVVTSTAGLGLIKRALSAKSYVSAEFIGGFALYVLGFGLWMLILHRLPLSVAFPVAASLLIVATQLTGVLWLGEKPGTMHMAGAAIVVAGLGVMLAAGLRNAQA